MQFVTLENVEQFVGKQIDCERRLWHYYPLTITKTKSGEYAYIDRNRVLMIFDKNTRLAYDTIKAAK